LAAGREDLRAGGFHFGRIGPPLHGSVAQRQAQIAGAQLGETQSRRCQDIFAVLDSRWAFNLYTEQKLALWIERPRLAAGKIGLLIKLPDRCRGWLGAT